MTMPAPERASRRPDEPTAPAVPPAGPSGVSVVIPCLNEKDSIAQVIEAARVGIARLGLEGEIIVVDNGCTDATVAIAERCGARIVVEAQRGYGIALRRGFAEARHEILVMGDGDQTYDFSRLDELVQPVLEEGAELVIGNRLHRTNRGSMPFLHRYLGNPFLSLALRVMFHDRSIHDAHCGMRAITRSAYRRLHCVTTGMEFASEMVVRAIDSKLRMVERNISYHPRRGESKLRPLKDGWRHLRFMMLHSPISMLLVPGILLWLLGIALSAPLAFGPVIIDERKVDIHFMMMGGLLNIVSIQFITMGLLAKAYAHLSGLRQDAVVAWLYNKITFERAILFAVPPILGGAYFCVDIVAGWVASGFGDLDEARPLFFSILCLVNGVQIALACYLFGIMALPRRVNDGDGSP